jgi:[acyl-carrier-protein] S-malonyltransferase
MTEPLRPRAAIFCPGRGSYTERSLGSLVGDDRAIDAAESLRREYGLVPLRELDGAARFDPALHLDPVHVSALIYVATWLDSARAAREHRAALVGGNSMGWYSALAVAGALSFEDGFRLVQTMALLQKEQRAAHGGGQVLYPLVDDEWRAKAEHAQSVESALASAAGEAFRSIDLGGFAVLAGTEDGVRRLLATLPKTKLGSNLYPLRLMQHGAYHTPLLESVAERAREQLEGLRFRVPRTTMVDGRGRLHSAWSTDVDALREYTLGAQVTTPYDLTASIRVALREYAPERIVLPGPGNTLGSICAQILIREEWQGLRSKADFEALQSSARPLVLSMRR